MSMPYLEWAPFKLRAGASEAALIQASDALQHDFLRQQPGFVRRQLMRARDGGYVDLVWWASSDAASAAMARAAESTACVRYFEQMDADHAEAGAGVALFEPVKAYE